MIKDINLSNHQIVTLAVYLIGGDSQYVDTEEIAMKANDLAPGRFTWRKYPVQISLENVSKRLYDVLKDKHGAYLCGSRKKGWILSEAGLKFAKQHLNTIANSDLSKQNIDPKEKKWRQSEKARLLASEAYAKLQIGNIKTVTKREAEAFFRLDDYVTGEARLQKILRIKNIFGKDADLGLAIKQIASKIDKES